MCAFNRFQCREINRVKAWFWSQVFDTCQITSVLNCFVVDTLLDVPLSIPDRPLVIPTHCEITRIVEMPRTLIFFCPKENRYILDVTTSPATGLRKAWRRRGTITVFCYMAFFVRARGHRTQIIISHIIIYGRQESRMIVVSSNITGLN